MIAVERWIIALAYYHRYGWIFTMIALTLIWPKQFAYIVGCGGIIFSVWSFVGYKCKWRHIYCSHQNASHEKMTPNSIQWSRVKTSDAYGIPIIFFVLGVALIICTILY